MTNQEHLKICEDFGKTKNKDSRGIRRLYSGRNSVTRSQGKLFEEKHLKRWKNRETRPGHQYHAPRALWQQAIRLGHSHAPRAWPLRHSHTPRACVARPVHPKCAGRKHIFLRFVGKACFFSSNSGRNSHYKYQPSSFKISLSK